jgi:hypothetical protein
MKEENKKQIRESIQKELDAYASDSSAFKSYFTSMKEISEWLKERIK